MCKETAGKIVEHLRKEVSSANDVVTSDAGLEEVETLERVVVMASEGFQASHGHLLGPIVQQAKELKASARLGLETSRLRGASTEFLASGNVDSFLEAWNKSESFHPSFTATLVEVADFCVSSMVELLKACMQNAEFDKDHWQVLRKLTSEVSEACGTTNLNTIRKAEHTVFNEA